MKESPFIDFNKFNSPEDAIKNYFINNFVGYRTSSWPFLRDSARTCLLQSIIKTSEILNSYDKNISKSMPREECRLVLWLQYGNFLNGLLLSTIILSSFAIESFVRHCFTTLIRKTKDYESHLKTFDKKTAIGRINLLLEKAESDKFHKDLLTNIKDLISYRNNIAHDDPLLFLSSGKLEQIKKGKKRTVNENKTYPLLPTDNMPLNLSHALKAANTHDSFISHVMNSANNKEFKVLKKEIDLTGTKLILAGLPKKISVEDIKRLSKLWIEKINEELNIEELKNMQNLAVNLKRKANIKLVK